MLFKLSLKNIKKSIKDYSIYFFTLVFAVAMFYMFNSIDAQESMLKLNSAKRDLIDGLIFIISYISVFVSIILGFLIVYSNNFLIRKRKKEIGLYFTLGMSKRKVSMILVIETLIIGLVSLIVGLICGVFLSQFISIFTAKLFEVDMGSFKFIFSETAFTKTLLYFGIIFVLVMIFNVITLSRYKLIDLLTASRKNEKVKLRNKYITIIAFILSLTLIGYAYSLLFDHALLIMNSDTIMMLVCGAIGTFLLFFSLSGFLLRVVERIKPLYYRGLNIFALKQINSRINTTVISTTIISLMLLLTIGILSGSISMASAFNNDLKENNLTDYTINISKSYEVQEDGSYNKLDIELNNSILSLIEDKEFKNYSKETVMFSEYYQLDGLKESDMMTDESKKKLQKKYGDSLSMDSNVSIMAYSDYKKLMNLFGKKAIDIKDDEYLLLTNVSMIVDAYTPYYKSKTGIEVNGKKLKPASNEIIETALINFSSAGNIGVVVVNDEIVEDLELNMIHIVGNYVDTNDVEKLEDEFIDYIHHKELDVSALTIYTKIDMETSSVGLKAILIFLGLYLGITFAITSATVLAIGELSQASDNKKRYKVLRQLGADNKMLNKTLLIQIGVSFIFPLIVALIHSYFGLSELNTIIEAMGNIDLTSSIILTTLFIVIVYGGYFIITYVCSKGIIKNK